jgi:general secretion pathway protein D
MPRPPLPRDGVRPERHRASRTGALTSGAFTSGAFTAGAFTAGAFTARAAALVLFALAGCGLRTPTPPVASVPAPLRQPSGNVVAAPRIDGPIGRVGGAPPTQTAFGAAPTGSSAEPTDTGGPGEYSLDFADTDIREVANQILGQMLRVSYTIDPAVRGTATFHTAAPLPRSRLLPVLQVLLGQSQAALVQSAGLYRVVPVAEAAVSGTGSDDTAGSIVIPLRYASADALVKVLQPFVTSNGRLIADAGRNAVLVSGEPTARASLISLVDSFDVDQLAGQSYAMLPVTSGDAKDFASALQDALRGGANGSLAGLVRVIPLERLSAVLVAAQQPRYIEEVRRVYNLVERQRRFTVRTWHVYYLQNSHANDVAYVLQQAFTPHNVTAPAPGSDQKSQQGASFNQGGGQGGGGSGQSGGGLGGGGLGGGGSGGVGGGLGGGTGGGAGGGLGSGLGGGTGGGAGGGLGSGLGGGAGGLSGGTGASAGGQSNPLLGGLDTSGGSQADEDTMRIIPNVQNNAVLVYATPEEETTVSSMLHKIDILPLQVRIDAVIAEVTLNDALQYGTQFFFKEGSVNQTLSTASAAAAGNTVTGSFPGFVFAASSKAVNAAISALQNVTTVNVLSSPELLVLDNQPARLLVGELVPYLTQSSQSTITSGSPVINSVDYRQTGVIMEVTPRVNSGGLVTLDVSQEVSEVENTTSTSANSQINSPTFSDRSVVSRVVVQDGQTVGLAGLIQESRTVGNSGIPWLKDIPVLGLLAGTQSNSRTRTELLILITPHVVRDQRDAQALTEDLREQLPNAAVLGQEVNSLPLTGSPDPSQRLRARLSIGP